MPALAGQVFDDPAGDVEASDSRPQVPPEGLGDVRRVAVDVDGGVLSVTAALDAVGEPSPGDQRAVRYGLTLSGSFTSARSTFEELYVTGGVNDRGDAGRASVSVVNQNLETNDELCRGRAGLARSRGLVRVEVPLSCLPGGRLRVADPSIGLGVTGRGFDGEDTVDLGVRRLSAG